MVENVKNKKIKTEREEKIKSKKGGSPEKK